MRPLKLLMQAFGPYENSVEVDFEKLGESGIYLISGSTGAGKTTIFDAIVYALYGKAGGNDRDASMLRNRSAAASVKTLVTLDFSYRGTEYRVTRSPAYETIGARGGVKTNPVSAELVGGGYAVTKAAEVTRAVESITGLDCERFMRIVMLAQGDFRRMLFADTETQSEIFRKIYGTEIYRKIEQILKERFKNASDKIEDGKKALDTYLNSLKIPESFPEAEEFRAVAEKAVASPDELKNYLEKLTAYDLECSEKASERLEKQSAVTGTLNAKIAKAEEVEKTRASLLETEEKLSEKQKALPALESTLEIAREKIPEKTSYEERLAEIKAKLPRYETLEKEKRKNAGYKAKRAELSEKLSENGEKLDKLIKGAKSRDEELSLLQKSAERLGELRLSGEKNSSFLKAVQNDILMKLAEIDSAARECERAKSEYLAAEEKRRAATDEYQENYRRFMDGQAGILAGTLEDDMPCPVCGSKIHPEAAKMPQSTPTADKLDCLKAAMERLEKASGEKSVAAGEKNAALETIRNAALKKGEETLGEAFLGDCGRLREIAEKKYKELFEKGKALKSEISAAAEAEKSAESLKNEQEKARTQEKRLTEESAEIKSAISANEAASAETEKHIAECANELEFSSAAEAEREIAKLSGIIVAIDTEEKAAETALGSAKTEIERLKAAKGALLKTISESGENSEMSEFSECETLDALRESLAAEEEKRRLLQTEMGEAAAEKAANLSAKEKISAALKSLEADGKLYSDLKALSDTAGAKLSGKRKISLEVYVQSIYFERVLKCANRRFVEMTDGRYELVRRAEPDNNKSRTGLDIDVADHAAGSIRSVKSLSGGESFIASLSLALGLSDEIQRSAGGIKPDTLFIDEGFGSLDNETLEKALGALMKLSESTKLVGIISHVSELGRRINKKIIVDKLPGGKSAVKVLTDCK